MTSEIFINLKVISKTYIYGKSRFLIKKQMGLHDIYEVYESLEKALNHAWKHVTKFNGKSTIIFAPACASFDQFENFEKRGKYFNKLVLNKIKI